RARVRGATLDLDPLVSPAKFGSLTLTSFSAPDLAASDRSPDPEPPESEPQPANASRLSEASRTPSRRFMSGERNRDGTPQGITRADAAQRLDRLSAAPGSRG